MNNPDLIQIIGKYTSEDIQEIRYRVIERLGIIYEDKPVTQKQIREVIKQVESDFR